MNAWKVILATLVIFGAGVITGGLLVRFIDGNTPHPPSTQASAPENPRRPGTQSAIARQNKLPPPNLPGPLRKDFLDRLDHDLKLSPQQRECIEKIICEGQERTKAIWEEVEPDMHEVLTETRSRICGELTPEQRTCFEQSLKQQKAKNASTNAPPAAPAPATVKP